jgi:transposase
MHKIELYAAVRQFIFVDGNSQRHAAQVFGLSGKTVKKMCEHPLPLGLQRTRPGFKRTLGPFVGFIDEILKSDLNAPPKQRHTAGRIYERLRDEHGYTGRKDTVVRHVSQSRPRIREAFVPLLHPPGHAQVDFGEAVAVIAGERRKVHVFHMILPHSDAPFLKAYPAETTAAFLDGHISAFRFFGKVPHTILYDNTALAVGSITGDGVRYRTKAFSTLVSYYLFKDRFCRIARGNDKAKVEGLVKHGRRSFLTPVPVVESIAELNRRLESHCLRRRHDRVGREGITISARLPADLAACGIPPVEPLGAYEPGSAVVAKSALVRLHNNFYSVPTRHVGQRVETRGYVDDVVIVSGKREIARHPRSYGTQEAVYNPLHYLRTLARKPAAFDQAAPLQDWCLPRCFESLRRAFEKRLGPSGKREYIEVLRLLEAFELGSVTLAVKDAMRLGVIGSEAVKRLIVTRISRRPKRLNLQVHLRKRGEGESEERYRCGGPGSDETAASRSGKKFAPRRKPTTT